MLATVGVTLVGSCIVDATENVAWTLDSCIEDEKSKVVVSTSMDMGIEGREKRDVERTLEIMVGVNDMMGRDCVGSKSESVT